MKPRTNIARWLMAAALLLSLVQISEAGRLRRLVYTDMNGAALTNLFAGTNNFGEVVFPDNPSTLATDFMPPELSWGSLNPPFQATTTINAIDNYGAWVKGYFTAPETGPYTFYMTTDDEAMWTMTTDPADSMNPTKTNLLCYVEGWAGATDWGKYASQTSPQVNLEKGKTYYMEIFQKEGGGGDHIVLGFTPPSGITQRPMPAWHFQSFRDTRFGEPDVSVVIGPVTPRVSLGVVDAGLYDGMEAVVYANVNLDPPVTYQWYKNGSPISGATGSYYITRVSTADANSTWKCVARSGGVDYQNENFMNVFPDNEAPTVVSLSQAPFNPTAIRIVFSEAVDPAQALLASSYTISGATVTITNVDMDIDGKTVYLRLGTMLPFDAAPTVTINGVRDYATPANVMTAYSQQMLPGEGALSLRLWRSRPADNLGNIRNWSGVSSAVPSYVNEEYSEQRFVYESRSGWDLGDNYTGQLVGFVTAPETGAYEFVICSDDHSVLYLGTDHTAASKREIAYVDGYTGQWEHNKYPSQRSTTPINLVKGQRYYLEVVWQDGTGGDGATIAWRKPSTTADWPTGTAEADLRPFMLDVPLLAPKVTYGPVALKTDLPTTLTAAANTRPTISVTPDGYIPWSYQWYSNNVAIPGATSASYQFPFLPLSADGAKYKVVVTNYFSSVTSKELTLSVYEDVIKPTVLSAGSAIKQQVNVVFSEPLNLQTATNAANYKIYSSGGAAIAITSATALSATNILLATAAMTDYDQARIEIRNVTDMADLAVVDTTNIFTAFNFDELARINNSQAYSAIGNGDQISLIGGGADIWGNADGMVYLYKNVTGNFDVKMRVDSLFRADNWTKAGPMFRASLANGSINWFLAATPTTGQNQFSAQVRPVADSTTYSSGDGGSVLTYNVVSTFAAARPTIGSYPKWLRLQRIGEVFYYHYSNDGSNWVLYTWYDSMGSAPASGMLGIALTSHTTGNTAEGVIGEYRPLTPANAGPIVITTQPANATVAEVGTATFTVAATGYTPLYYQWYKGTTPIADATNSTLVLTRVPLADNNAAISVKITSPYVTTPVTSDSATLTVTPDNTVPTVAYWSGNAANLQTHPTEVKLIYSEPVNRADAENLANYALSPVSGGAALSISSAALGPDDRIVTLTLGSSQVAGTIYKVVVNNVRDLASPAKTIAANSTATYFYAGNNNPGRHLQRADGYVLIEGENWTQNTSATVNAGGTSTTFEWTFGNTAPNYSGRGYAYVPNDPAFRAADVGISGDVGNGALVEYEFVTTLPAQNYTVWVRGWNQNTANSGADDQVHVGLQVEGGAMGLIVPSNRDQSSLGGFGAGGWDWRSDRVGGSDPMVITNLPPGTHRIAFWQRDDGFLLDKICLEPGVRSGVGNSSEPGVASGNGGLGQTETQDWIVAPPAAPTIALATPTNTMVFAANSTIAMEATVTPVSPVTKVDFLVAGQVVATATTAPYTYNWANVPEGIYGVQARVTDNVGYVVTTGTATVTVDSTKPVAYAVGSLRGNGLGVYFNDLSGIDQTTATNVENYVVNGGAVAVTGARLEPDNHAVTLTLDQQLSGSFSVLIKNVADRGFGPNVIDPITLSSTVVNTFVSRDVGTITNQALMQFSDPLMPGIAHAIGTDALYMRAGGSDIWNNQDGIHFAYTELTGDFDVSARVYGLSRPDNWTKMGLMVREDLDGTSRHYNVITTATNGQNAVYAQWRLVKGTGSGNTAKPGPIGAPNTYLRMTREGQKFTAWWSTNGVDWTTWNNQTMSPAYPDKVYVGLALTSHNNGASPANQASAYIDNIKGFFGAVPTQPMLTAKIQGANLVLTWSAASAFKVQESTTLGTWADSAVTPVQSGDNYTVTLPVSTTGSKFYRLSD